MACSITLAGLTYDCERSKGGIKKVLIAQYDATKAAAIKAAASGETPTVPSGLTFYAYDFRRNTGSMTSTLNVDEANGTNYVSTDLVLQFGRMDAKKRTEISALSIGELMIFVEDANGQKWFLGADAPVTASAGTGQTGQAMTDGNFYNITLTAQDDDYPISWGGELPEAANNA